MPQHYRILPLFLLAVTLLDAQVPISRIQGPGAASPLAGQRVETQGVVTARRTSGFYIQSLPADDDHDPATSEGLLVFTGTRPAAAIQPGAAVRVTGTVTEFRPAADPASPPLTELATPEVTVVRTGEPVPAPVFVDFLAPAAGPAQLEHLEGMRVAFPPLRAVSATSGTVDAVTGAARDNGVFWAVIEGSPRPFRALNFDGAPERLRIVTAGLENIAPFEVRAGAVVNGLRGVLDYGFRAYSVLVETASPPSSVEEPSTLIAAGPGELAAASMNLRQLYDDVDDPGGRDPAVTTEAFRRRIARIAETIRGRLGLPQLIAVQEVENRNALDALAAALGPRYRAWLEEGNDISGIDSGFLIDTSAITVESVVQVGKDERFLAPAGTNSILHDRPPLVLTARAAGLRFRAINLHLRSFVDTEDPGPGGDFARAKRAAQASAAAALAATLQRDNPADGLLVLGDFNAYPFSDGAFDTVGAIANAASLVNLATTLPADQGYTYVFEGTAQILDHILVNPVLRARWTRYQVAHVNADFPETLPRDSDHDHPVAHFALTPRPLTAAAVTSAASFLTGAFARGQLITVFTSAPGLRVNGDPVTPLAATPTQVTFLAPVEGDALVLTAQGQSEPVRIPFPALTAPAIFAAERAGEHVLIHLTGCGLEPIHVWIDGRPAAQVSGVGPFTLAALPAPQTIEPQPEITIVCGGRRSQPGLLVR